MLQKMRAGLAVLGIFIGTATVIWLVAMGEGVSRKAQQQIEELGANNIIVRSIKPTKVGETGTPLQSFGLLRADLDRIRSNIESIESAIPLREVRREVRRGEIQIDAKVLGCTLGYLENNRLEVHKGRWFRPLDAGENVAVLAHALALELFPIENPVGQSVRIGSDVYRVIGQMQPRVASAAIGGSLEARDYGNDIYIPIESYDRRVGDAVAQRIPGGIQIEEVELSQITLTVSDPSLVDDTAQVVEDLLDRYHDLEDYAVVVPKELLAQARRTKMMFNLLLVVIAGISLFVGGIGIMNIMLATVTERTKEIGIRRALGARQQDITWQFLIEAIVLTGCGGILGVLVGTMCGPIFRVVRFLINWLAPEMLPQVVQEIEPQITLWSVVFAFAVSLLTGLTFGVYPARQAAMLDPIVALRVE